MAKHLADLDEDIADTVIFTWHVTSWSSIVEVKGKRVSPEFQAGGHTWYATPEPNIYSGIVLSLLFLYRRIAMYPNGSDGAREDAVSTYLEYVKPRDGAGWQACVQFILVISNPKHPTSYIVDNTGGKFCSSFL